MKKQISKRLFALLMAICMLVTLSPVTPVAAEETATNETTLSTPEAETETDALAAAPAIDLTADCAILNYVDEEVFAAGNHVLRLEDEETLSSYVFLNADGTKTVYYLDEAVKFVDSDGSIQEKDVTLALSGTAYTTTRNDISLSIPNDPASGITLIWNGHAVRIIPQGGTLSDTVLDGNSIRYTDYYGAGADLVYTPTLAGVKEDIVLESYTGQNTFTFMLNTGGLNLYSLNGRYYLAESKVATDRIELGDLVTFDANGRFSVGTMTSQTVSAGNIYRLTLTVDEEFLTDPDTVYPVSIDPTINVKDADDDTTGSIEDVSIYQGRPTINADWTYLHSGYYDSTYGKARTMFRLTGLINSAPFTDTDGYEIESAYFVIREATGTAALNVHLYANEGSNTWTESGVTWNNSGHAFGDTPYDTEAVPRSSDATYDITDLVLDWQTGDQDPLAGFLLVSSNETSLDKAFYSSEFSDTEKRPYVVVTYLYTTGTIITYQDNIPLHERVTLTVSGMSGDITWASSNPDIASVEDGVVLGKQVGQVTITASAEGYETISRSFWVTVPDGVYYIQNDVADMYLGTSGATTASLATYLRNYTSDEIARYNQLWKVTYLGNNRYTIRPMNRLASALTKSTTGQVLITNIGIYDHSTAVGTNARWSFIYDSGSYNIVNNYNMSYALNPTGSAASTTDIIRASAYSNAASYRWTLTEISDLTLYDTSTRYVKDGALKTMKPSEIKSLSAFGMMLLNYGYGDTITWRSTNSSIATVDSNGTVTAVGYGAVQIVASKTSGKEIPTVSYRLVVSEIPVSGYELDYEPDLWNNVPVNDTTYVKDYTNCYSYAINAQLKPGTSELLWMNPGKSDGDVIAKSNISKDTIIPYIERDAENYGFLFQECTADSACPNGAYKVALVVDPANDYHWYRQNADGTWSHKPSYTEVVNVDARNQIIYDPYFANRNYPDYGVNYTDFVGYYFIIPLNTMYGSSTSTMYALKTSNDSDYLSYEIDKRDLPSIADCSSVSVGMSYKEITNLIGFPQKPRAFGLQIAEYAIAETDTVLIVEFIHTDGQLVARSCKFEGVDNNE